MATKTMVYAPDVIALIHTKKGILDISDDIVRGRVTNRIDAASDFALTLSNKGNKYTGKIQRMDKVVIFMKRINWIQVFSGYTTVVPVFDLYPTTVAVTGTCSIIRLQNFYWNPYTPDSQEIMYQASSAASTPNQKDSGIGNMLLNVINKVGNWDPSTIHIQNLPDKFLEFANNIQKTADTPADLQAKYLNKIADMLGVTIGAAANIAGTNGTGGVAGTANTSATSIAAGGPNVTFTIDQLVAQAYAVGVPSNQLAMAASIALAESGGRTFVKGGPNSNGSYDYGLWQINDIHKKSSFVVNGDMSSMLDPGNNAKAMFSISGGGVNWKPWSTFNNGAYLQFMTRAKEAVAKFDPTKLPTNNQQPTSTTTTAPGTSVGEAAQAAVSTGVSGSAVGTVQAVLSVGFAQKGIPYSWGGGDINGPSKGISDGGGTADAHGDYNKVGFDCSGLVQYIFYKGTGGRVKLPGTTKAMRDSRMGGLALQLPGAAVMQPGDIILNSHHVAVFVGNGMMLEAPNSGSFVKISNMRVSESGTTFWRVNGVVNDGTPIDLGSAGNDSPTGSPNTANDSSTVGASTEQLATGLFRFQFLGNSGWEKNVLTGDDSYINTEPLFNTVKTVCAAGMRSFMSAPNGDFVAFYPDPFGIMGKKPSIIIEDVELVNFSISLNDGALTTHVFSTFNPDQYSSAVEDYAWQTLFKTSVGIEDTAVMETLLNISGSDLELNAASFYSKYGVRPHKIRNGDIKDTTFNYFQALYTFLQKWSDQYNTRVDLTFMPEVYPGMRMKIASQGVTVYVKEVSHEFGFDSGFTTSCIVNSPTTEVGGIPGMVLG